MIHNRSPDACRCLFNLKRFPNIQITMDADMPPRTYQMVANVVDKRRNEKAQGVVNVIVKMVPAAAFENQVLFSNLNLETVQAVLFF